uniref:EB domain-containing protein n=1 Tax=Homalodisca liturata TaxID=320908 RepID=A0A1B6HPB5_9HEMI
MAVKYLKIGIALLIIYCLHLSENTHIEWTEHSRKHGEPCINHDQCTDFRMICSETEFVCQCDQFHDWTELNAYTSECVPNPQRLRSFLSENHETKGVEEKLSEEAHNLFVYLGLSGIIVISCGILLAFACIIFAIS